MDRESLKKLAADKKFISGIYNYCDRWCERCPQTSRCLNFTMSEEEFADPESRDINNEEFWKKMSGIFMETLELVKEMAESQGIDLDSLDYDEIEKEESSVRGIAENHCLSRAANEYTDIVDNWFSGARALSGEKRDAEKTFIDPLQGYDSDQYGLKDTLDVVKWYQHLIYVKLMRAITGSLEDKKEISDELFKYPKDSDGSAKVALIGIDRSIAAWDIIGRHFPSLFNEDISFILTYLEKLRRKIEEYFPEARGFIRPGFDQIDLNS